MPNMILALYVATVLLLFTAAFVIVGYGTNNSTAAASTITQQQQSSMMSEQYSNDDDTTVTQQSSGSLQSSSSSNSVIVSESTSSDGVSSSNSIVTSTGNNNLQINMQSSGKIASSRLNLTSGEVEAVLFGNWSLNSTSGFVTNFTYKPSNGTGSIEFRMSGLEVHSVNQINNNLVLAGMIDVLSNNSTVLQDAPVTIMIQNGILVVGFENMTEATNVFGGMPIIGYEQ
jgi:hypothetical protein